MRTMAGAGVIVSFVVACSHSTDPPVPGDADAPFFEVGAPARSGTRLKLRWYVWDDGSLQWDRGQFFDVDRHEWCFPFRWEDGRDRCTPDGSEAVFANPDCTGMLARIEVHQVKPYVLHREHVSLPAQHVITRAVYALGERLATQPTAVYLVRDGVCVAHPVPAVAEYYSVGAELPQGELATLTETAPDPAQRLSLIYRTSADGLGVPYVMHDALLGRRCAPAQRPNQPTAECVPLDTWQTDRFADAQCTKPIVGSRGAIPAPIAATPLSQHCRRFYAPGTELTPKPTTEYRQTAQGCSQMPVPPDAGERLWLAGAPLTLASADRVIDSVPGRRLQRVLFGGLDDAVLHDTEVGADCGGAPGDTCAPISTTLVFGAYSDGACKQEVQIGYVPDEPCLPTPTRAFSSGKVHEILGPPAGLYIATPGWPHPCALYVPMTLDGYILHLLGPGTPVAPALTSRIVDPAM